MTRLSIFATPSGAIDVCHVGCVFTGYCSLRKDEASSAIVGKSVEKTFKQAIVGEHCWREPSSVPKSHLMTVACPTMEEDVRTPLLLN
ncbi:hypothetical protein SUGI_0907550 [Cryptomeria japonica]|nr:hypothetical protein SUGI_0907550 [Cryptomeria japonica]